MGSSHASAMLVKGVLLACLLVIARSQLVLEDEPGAALMEGKDGGVMAEVGEGGLDRKEASDPMTRMLQWGMENSDLSEMGRKAQLIREGKMKPAPVDREAMEILFADKAKFLTKVVEWVKEAVTEGDESKIVEALEELESQVTDIDNAGDLDHVGGVDLVLELLTHPMAKVRQTAFWVVGTTVQSHSKMQEMLLARGVLPKIMQPLEKAASNLASTDPRLLGKTIYALSAFLRTCPSCFDAFTAKGGAKLVAKLLSAVAVDQREDSAWIAAKRKCASLAGDLVQEEGVPKSVDALVTALSEGWTPSVSKLPLLLRTPDKGVQEAAMVAIEALVTLRPLLAKAMNGLVSEVADLSKRTMAEAQGNHGDSSGDLLMLCARLHDLLVNATSTNISR